MYSFRWEDILNETNKGVVQATPHFLQILHLANILVIILLKYSNILPSNSNILLVCSNILLFYFF